MIEKNYNKIVLHKYKIYNFNNLTQWYYIKNINVNIL